MIYVENMSNSDLVKAYNEKQKLINECCKAVRLARGELAKIIDEVDERSEEENISVVEFYQKYEEKLDIEEIAKNYNARHVIVYD